MNTVSQGRQFYNTRYTNGRNTQTRGYERSRYGYQYASTAADLNRMLDSEPEGRLHADSEKRKEKSVRMDLKYVILCVVGLFIILAIVVSYVKLRSAVTQSIENASNLENTYVNLKIDNDEEYNRIINSVDMNEVKRIATEELGMHYAKEGQVIVYTNDMDDYVKQYSDME